MQHENTNLIREEAWKCVARADFDGALRLVFGQVHKHEKQHPEIVAIYGCCLSMVQGNHKEGMDICKKAMKAAPKKPNLHFLLGLVYMSADLRTKAVDIFEKGLELAPEHTLINRAMSEMGERQKVSIPFLSRSHPLNISLGRKRHERKMKKREKESR